MSITGSLCEQVISCSHQFVHRKKSIFGWLCPKVISNEPNIFSRLVTQRFPPHMAYAQTYFDDILFSRLETTKNVRCVKLHMSITSGARLQAHEQAEF